MAVHLHVHSNFSFGRGASTIADLCAAASRRGIRAMALTDVNGLYGAIPFVEAAGACGVKPIIGAEVSDGGGHRAILLAADRKGYGRLCAIITARHTRPSFSLPDALAGGRGGMVVLTDHLPLLRFLLSETGIRRDLYVEVPPRLEAFKAARSPSGLARGELAAFARRAGLPVTASHAVHFAEEGDFELACVLRAIFENASYPRVLRDRGEFSPSSWLLPAAALERGFEDLPGARRGALEIADRCGFVPETGRILLPRHPDARGPADSMRLLRARCAEGLRKRFGPAPGQKVLRRLRYEIGMIESMNFADYFLIVSDVAAFARGRSIPMCGRGSAAGSLVSYALGMTDVDPVARSLSFERFLHTGRKDPPDVDIDFAWNRRDEVIDFVYGRFGRERVAAISTHVTFAARGALREVARAMGIPDAQVSGVARLIPWHMSARRMGEAGGSLLKQEPWRSVVRFAVRLDGFPKHLGIHVGGIVVSPGPLSDYLPAEVAPKGIVITQWEMTGVEKAGLLKIDLLGNRSLSVIDDVLGDISRGGEERARASRSPFFTEGPAGRLELAGGDRLEADEGVRRLMRTGDSFGCFYVESPAMQGLLRKLRCDTFGGLVAASSVIRPGVSSSGMMRQYIERARGRPFRCLHPVMEKLLGETFGVMVYQEDVMKLAYHAGGLSWEDGNLMRKAMSGKRGGVPIERYREKFLAGAAARGIPPEIGAEIWRQMASFAGYSFCKAHSAAFAEVSMRALYLRAHWPAEFMAAVLSNHGGYYGAPAYISECRRMGLDLLHPSVNESEVRFTGGGRRVRIGLGQIAKLRGEAAAAIVEERRAGGRFLSLEDFLERMKGRLEKDEVESMVLAGALDEFDAARARQRLLWESARLAAGKAPAGRGGSLHPPREQSLPSFHCDDATRARMEIEALGFPVACHIMDLVRPAMGGKEAALRARHLPRLEGRRVTLAGMVITMKPIRTARGSDMSFVSMEDETGAFEVTLFPSAYARARRLLAWSAGPYLVTGRVESDFGHLSLIGEEVRPISVKTLP